MSPKLRSQIATACVSVVSIAIGIALSKFIPGVSAAPTMLRSSTPLYELDINSTGVTIFMSSVAATIFGEEAADFDYYVGPDPAAAVEAATAFAAAHYTGDIDEMVVTFLNATMAGTMTADQAADTEWRCRELSSDMASTLDMCAGAAKVQRSVRLSGRSTWSWVKSAKHQSTKAAVQILYGALGNVAYSYFPSSPRSWCNTADGTTACISWSTVETFQHAYAQSFISDALNVVDFDSYSAQTDKALTKKRSSAADVCISNRAKGCT